MTVQQGCCKVDASSPKTWHMYFTLKCLYETGKGHTNLIKMLMSFAKITYLLDTKKITYYCLIYGYIIA